MIPPSEAARRFRAAMSDVEMRQLWRDLTAAGCAVTCARPRPPTDWWSISVQHLAWDGPLGPEERPLPLCYYYRRMADGTWQSAA